MATFQENIFPLPDHVTKEEKEKLLRQKAKVIWFTGLSGSGKTTIARLAALELFKRGYLIQLLDGDNLRSGINSNLDFTDEGRIENIRRIAEISKLFVNSGIITINSFIAPTPAIRKIYRDIIPKEDLLEIYINAPLAVCEQRDVKGLYKKAREGKIKNFTGIGSPFIPPVQCDLVLDSATKMPDETVIDLLDFVYPLLNIKQTNNICKTWLCLQGQV
ncbi:MAG: adenylyl-sulfate kinase [Bacteroidales bacterium]|nr:adenylyl-sulfate kinase [Bacteroidales bacterium]